MVGGDDGGCGEGRRVLVGKARLVGEGAGGGGSGTLLKEVAVVVGQRRGRGARRAEQELDLVADEASLVGEVEP